MQTFHANGKLLLTGEYAILDGAKAIGLPTKLGQKLWIEKGESKSSTTYWKALLHDGSIWFETEIDTELFSYGECTDKDLANSICEILKSVEELNPNSVYGKSYRITTQLEFPKDWGLGSSSTLMALLAKCFDINPYALLEKTFGGSGYDVSCAMMPRPQTYQLTKNERKISFVELHPDITQHLYFVYLNQKQNSREGIQLYRSLPKSKSLIKGITDITNSILTCDHLYDFEDLVHVHEQLISNHLGLEPVQQRLFSDYRGGEVKSLGAWGGDFVLVTSESGDLSYFERKGYGVIFGYNELMV